MLTKSKFNQLSARYVKFKETTPNSRSGSLFHFRESLAKNPKMQDCFDSFIKAIESIQLRTRILAGNSPISFNCYCCNAPIVRSGANALCSPHCNGSGERYTTKSQVIQQLKTIGFKLVELDFSANGKCTIQCVDCKQLRTYPLRYNLHHHCSCKRKERVAAAVRGNAKPLQKRLKDAGLDITVLGEYKNSNAGSILVRCNRSGMEWNAWPGNLAKGHCCKVCGTNKNRETQIANYGSIENALRAKRATFENTMNERYGVSNALQSSELFDKMVSSSYKTKVTEVGKSTKLVQGYEAQAIPLILKDYKLRTNQIQCGVGAKIPKISYRYKNVDRVYHPDIFIPSLNLIIEVKSKYTYKTALRQNMAKRKACLAAGYDFEFYILDSKGSLINGN